MVASFFSSFILSTCFTVASIFASKLGRLISGLTFGFNESNAPDITKDSIVFLLTWSESTLLQKSNKSLNNPFSSRAFTIAIVASVPTFLIAFNP